jgi:hypothetical protein
MAHCLILLHHLYVLDDPSWDRAAARERVDLFALGDRLISILAEIGASSLDDNMFTRFSRMIRSMCSAWWAELQSDDRNRSSQGPWPAPHTDADPGTRGRLAHGEMTPTPAAHLLEMMPDDAWLNELFNMS